MEIFFKRLDESHFRVMHRWFNKPHVQAFYSLRYWTLDEVRNKLIPYVKGQNQITGFIIFFKKQPIGYIQSYPIQNHPWENQNLPEETVQKAAGFDLFIGEEKYVGKGLGSRIIESFLDQKIWPVFEYFLADPDVSNEHSIRLFEKCGFKRHQQVQSKNPLGGIVTLQLFIRKRDNK